MAAIIWSNVTAFTGTSLANVNDTAQTFILQYVNGRLDVCQFDGEDGFQTRQARIYLAAHMGLMTPDGGTGATSAGPVTSESAGGLSRSYGSASGGSGFDDAWLSQTAYGRAFLSMVRVSMARLPMVI